MNILVVGAGVAGLTFAVAVSKTPHHVVVMDQHDQIGGLNRAWYDEDGYFMEHAPRVFADKYSHFQDLLEVMNMDFFHYFDVAYQSEVISWLRSNMTWLDLFRLGTAIYLYSSIPEESVEEMAKRVHISSQGRWLLDGLCSRLDGGGSSRFRFSHFKNLATLGGELRVPKESLTKLFVIWKQYLEDRGVSFRLNTRVLNVTNYKTRSSVVTIENSIHGKREIWDVVVLAIPPQAIVPIVPSLDPNLVALARATRYENYFSGFFTFTRHTPWEQPYIHLHPWMVVVVPHYDSNNRLVLSVAATKDVLDPASKKKPSDCKEHEFKEVINRIVPVTTGAIAMKLNFSKEPAYFDAVGTGKFPSDILSNNVYTCGSHTAIGGFPVTSIENAVIGGMQLAIRVLYS